MKQIKYLKMNSSKNLTKVLLSFFILLFLIACTSNQELTEKTVEIQPTGQTTMKQTTSQSPTTTSQSAKTTNTPLIKQATFAGGCFWCMEAAYEGIDGILDVVSGYSGGTEKNPTYEEVSSKETSHKEAVQVTYDQNIITYEDLLHTFWRQIDPTDDGGQFADRGPQYRTAIFYHNEEQKIAAQESKKEIQTMFDKKIVTEIIEYENFYKAEEYHQDYSQKRTASYKTYEKLSGRKGYKEDTWSDK